ncbi:MAG: glycine zipper domain-containing protein [Nanoarchaeota archaeon]
MSLTKRINKNIALVGLGLSAIVFSTSCETISEPHRGSGTGALFGALAGGLLGAATGHWDYALGGAAIGAGAGAIAGNEYDKDKMYQKIERVERDANTMIINVSNSNGSVIPVPIRRDKNIYYGPRGEIYNNIPTEDQLRKIYGF